MASNPSINLGILIWSGIRFGGAERRFARLAAYLATHSPNIQVTLYCLSVTIKPLSELGITTNTLNIVQLGS